MSLIKERAALFNDRDFDNSFFNLLFGAILVRSFEGSYLIIGHNNEALVYKALQLGHLDRNECLSQKLKQDLPTAEES
jgi:hypothetical protein